MEITNAQLAWSTDDEGRWDSFLQTETGKRLIPKLAESAPILLDGTDINKTLVRNGELRGFQLALRTLLDMTHAAPSEPQSISNFYPLPEDDRQWTDGHKLEKT